MSKPDVPFFSIATRGRPPILGGLGAKATPKVAEPSPTAAALPAPVAQPKPKAPRQLRLTERDELWLELRDELYKARWEYLRQPKQKGLRDEKVLEDAVLAIAPRWLAAGGTQFELPFSRGHAERKYVTILQRLQEAGRISPALTFRVAVGIPGDIPRAELQG